MTGFVATALCAVPQSFDLVKHIRITRLGIRHYRG
jgi:hypothetical protein